MLTIFDLEFTAWQGCVQTGWDKSKNQYREIVQIGAITFDPATLKEIKTFDKYIKPLINPVLSEYFINLTNITQEDVDQAELFSLVAGDFAKFCKGTTLLCYGKDNDVIKENCEIHKMDNPLKNLPCINLRQILRDKGITVEKYNSGGLTRHFGITPKHREHNALNDVLNVVEFLRIAKENNSTIYLH